jgi:hypothetical protein
MVGVRARPVSISTVSASSASSSAATIDLGESRIRSDPIRSAKLRRAVLLLRGNRGWPANRRRMVGLCEPYPVRSGPRRRTVLLLRAASVKVVKVNLNGPPDRFQRDVILEVLQIYSQGNGNRSQKIRGQSQCHRVCVPCRFGLLSRVLRDSAQARHTGYAREGCSSFLWSSL